MSVATSLVLVLTSVQIAPAAAQAAAPTTAALGPTIASLENKPTPTEVPSKRTATSNTYDNHDGTFTASISSGPINYLDPTSKTYQPIDTTLAPISGNATGRVRASKMATPVEVGTADDASGFVSLDTGKGVISLSLAPGVNPGKRGEKPTTTGSRAQVAGLMAGIDFNTTVAEDGLQTYFILNSRPSGSSFTLLLDTGGLVPTIGSDGSIAFGDAKGVAVATMPAPYAVDSNIDPNIGSGKTTYAVSYSLANHGKQYLLTVSVDATWLANATYPVYVDPSVVGSTQVYSANVSDLYPDQAFPNKYNSPHYELVEGYDSLQQWGAYLKFDVAAAGIPPANVTSAKTKLLPYYQWVSSGSITYVSLVTSYWSPGSPTWHNAPFSSNAYSPATISSFLSNTGVTVDIGLPLTTVQGWVSGSIPNYGVYLYGPRGDDYQWKRFVNSTDTTGAQKPELDITYSTPSVTLSSPIGNAWTSNSTLSWAYSGNGGPAQAWYRLILWQNFGSSWNQIVDTGSVWSSSSSYTVSPSALTDGGSYVWTVAVSDGYSAVWAGGSWLASVGTFRWDSTPPTWTNFELPHVQQSQMDNSYNFTWDPATDAVSGVAYYNLTKQSAAISSAGICDGAWTDMGAPQNIGNATSFLFTNMIGNPYGECYRIAVDPVDAAGNHAGNTLSIPVLFDSTGPSAPSVTNDAGQAPGSYQQSATQIFFRPSAAPGTINLTSLGTDTESDIQSNTFGNLSAPAGWTYSSSTLPTNPASTGLTWSATAGTTTLPVTTTNRANKPSLPTTVSLVADSAPPVIGFTSDGTAGSNWLPQGSTKYTSNTYYQFNWTEADAGSGSDPASGVAGRVVTRQKGPVTTTGRCDDVAYQTDSDATVGETLTAGSLTVTGLTSGFCYRWIVTVTDNVGNSNTDALGTSGPLMVDTSIPAVPAVTGTGTGTYQSGPSDPIFVLPPSGTVTVSSTAANDPNNVSGIASSTFTGDTIVGWTYTPGPEPGNPAAAQFSWGQNAVDLHLQVFTTTVAGGSSTAAPLTISPDGTAPTGNFNGLSATTLKIQSATSWVLTWGASDAGSQVATQRVIRQRAAVDPARRGTCDGLTFTNDQTFDLSVGTLSLNETGLQDGYCYRWQLFLTDHLGNKVTDGQGNQVPSSTSGFVLVDSSQPTAALSLVAPQAGVAFSGTITAIGTAADLEFSTYTLDYCAGSGPVCAAAPPSSWSNIVQSNTPVGTVAGATGTLGTWATGSRTGIYTVRLSVTDLAGNIKTVTSTVYVENTDRGSEPFYASVPFDLGGGWSLGVNAATGEASLGRNLFSVSSYGPPQALALTYNSSDARPNDPLANAFGPGWSSNLTQYLDLSNVAANFVVWHRSDGAEVPFGLSNGVWKPLAGHYQTLTLVGSNYLITELDHSYYSFTATGAALGRLSAITDRYGKSLSINWAGVTAGNGSATATDASGRAMTITFAGGTISRVTDSAGRAWNFGYQSSRLTIMTDPVTNATTFTYNGAGRLDSASRQLTPAGGSPATVKWALGYTGSQVTSVTDPIGAANTPNPISYTFSYDPTYATGLTTFTAPRDATGATPAAKTVYALDANARGYADSVTQDIGATAVGPTTATETTNYTYDDAGNVSSQSRQIDSTRWSKTTWTYDGAGEVLVQTDPTGITTTNLYDSGHNKISTTVAGTATDSSHLSVTTAYVYDTPGHLCRQVQNLTIALANAKCTTALTSGPDSNVDTAYTYNTNNQLLTVTNPLGIVTAYTYAASGFVTSKIANCVDLHPVAGVCTGTGTHDDTTNVTTTYAYDQNTVAGKLGLATTTTQPVTTVTPATTEPLTYTYDVLGHLLTTTKQGDATVPSTESVQAYDEFGNQISGVTCIPAQTTAALCTSNAATSSVTVYDKLGRVLSTVQKTSGKTATTMTQYDLAGDALLTIAADGTKVTRSFDALGRVIIEVSSGPTNHYYDGIGDETSTVAPAFGGAFVTTNRTFDAAGRPLTQVDDATAAAAATTFLYDDLGRQIGSIDAAGLTVGSTTYDHLGRVLKAVTTDHVSGVTTTVDTVYDRAGQVTSQTHPYTSGQTPIKDLTVYDGLGRVTSTTTNYVAGSSAPAANIKNLTYYDAAGDAVATVNPRGFVTRTIFDHGHAIKTIINCTDSGTGASTHPATCLGAGTSNNVTNVVSTASSTATAATGTVTTTSIVNKVNTTTTVDGAGHVLKTIVDPGSSPHLNLETDNVYDTAGRLVATRTPSGVVNVTVYDVNGRVSQDIANCTNATPGALMPQASWSACLGIGANDGTWNLTTFYDYDAAGNLITTKAPNGLITHYEYTSLGKVSKQYTSDSPSTPTFFYYDAAGREVATAVPNDDGIHAIVTRFMFDSSGDLTKKIDNCVDGGTNPAACTDSGPHDAATNVVTTYTYDAHHNRVSMTAPSPVDQALTVTTAYAYDSNDLLCRVLENGNVALQTLAKPCTDALPTGTIINATTNVDTQYVYDAQGNLTSQSVPPSSGTARSVTRYAYDALGQRISKTDPDGYVTSYSYDAAGNMSTETDPDTSGGATVAAFYDTNNRLCRRLGANGTTGMTSANLASLSVPCSSTASFAGIDIRYTYDAAGNLMSATDGKTNEKISATYDPVGRTLSVGHTGGSLSDPGTTYAYTSANNVTRADPSGTYGLTLDNLGRVTSMTDPINAGNQFAWSYGPTGHLLSTTAPIANGGGAPTTYTSAYAFDPLGRIKSVATTIPAAGNSTTTLASYAYAYSTAGKEMSATSAVIGSTASGVTAFTYDSLGRLASYTPPTSAQNQTYLWNPMPDRSSVKIGASTAVTTTFDAASRPKTDSASNTYSTDKEGRLTAGIPSRKFTYDSLGRLTTAKNGNTTLATYTYDPLGRLETETAGGITTSYLYVGLTSAIASVVVGSGASATTTRHATDAAGTELYEFDATAKVPTYLGRNAHGDVTWTGNATGTVTATATYDPFGNLASQTGSFLPASRWQGSLIDPATGLYYVVARWYAPTIGRFLSEDPLVGDSLSPQSLDRYTFGVGDPVGRIDPDGRCSSADRYSGCEQYGAADFVAALALPARSSAANGYNGGQASGAADFVAALSLPTPSAADKEAAATSLRRANEGFALTDRIANYMTAAIVNDINRGLLPHYNPNALFSIPYKTISIPYNQENLTLFAGFLVYYQSWSNCVENTEGYDAGLHSVCGIWDYKHQLSHNFYNDAPAWSDNSSPVRGDPEPERVVYDAWTNIHFGYMGAWYGIPEMTLRGAANHNGGLDDADWLAVQAGEALYRKCPGGPSATVMESLVLGLIPEWRRINDGHIVPGYF